MNSHKPSDTKGSSPASGMPRSAFAGLIGLLLGLVVAVPASATIAQQPIFLIQSARPLVMFAMSLDHQLWKKAYPDYSDLDGDGDLDTTYLDSFDYFGYFDSRRCYSYDSGVFTPRGVAVGPNRHQCNGVTGDWSGNMLNWASMTRMDIIRKTLFGGKRSTDTANDTVLERAMLPGDIHSFAKVFRASSAAEMARFTPFSRTTVTFCNTTPLAGGPNNSANVNTASFPPRMFVADGSFPRWAADEGEQCQWGQAPRPTTAQNLVSAGSRTAALNVRVRVCLAGREEDNCAPYPGSTVSKPTGLLQEYGEDGSLRFGMVSGSFYNHVQGGRLRRAIGQLANTGTNDDEVATNGTFTGNAGIIENLSNVRLNEWNVNSGRYNDCNTFGIPKSAFINSGRCSNWGNPLSEIYLEAVRNLTGAPSRHPAFDNGNDPRGLTRDTWTDPMPADEWCAPMNVVVVSSAENSFDTDNLNNVPSALGSIATATDQIGSQEGFGGSVFIGDNGAAGDDACTPKSFTSLSQMKGVCPAAPSLEGGYAIAGMAYKSHITDMRPDRQPAQGADPGQTINTFAVALARELPEFAFRVGGNDIAVLPTCRANNNPAATTATTNGWRACSLADLFVRETVEDGSGNLVYARFLALWEDSTWGNDYDKDGISQIAVCVGAECARHDDDGIGGNDTAVPAGQLRVTNRVVDAQAGNAMRFGFVISGSTADGLYSNVLRRQVNGSVLDANNDPIALRPPAANATQWSDPDVQTFTPGTSAAALLPSPLELAAKYGGFNDANANDEPDLALEWDGDGDSLPDNFFFADNPSLIGPKLTSFLDSVDKRSTAASVVANATSLDATTRIYQARFESAGWTGQLLSFPIDTATGALLPAEWDSAEQIAAQDWSSDRKIVTLNPGTGAGAPFRWASLTAGQQALLNTNATLVADGRGQARLAYLRGLTQGEERNNGQFRNRVHPNYGGPGIDLFTPLGAVVSSTPALVARPNSGWPDGIESAAPYSTFVNNNASRTPVVYFGSSDGMLHAVCARPAGETCGSTPAGAELFAFVPNFAFGTPGVEVPLSEFSDPDYAHRYIIDGALTIVDAFFSGDWHSVLVGTGAAGGKSIFALDVTDPSVFTTEGNIANNVVMWEKTAADLPDLGFTFSQPTLFKAQGQGWVVAVGNGYDSTSGRPVIYLLDAATGNLVETLTLAASGSEAIGNGVSSISPIDTDNDGEVDLIYAGDLRGNVWRLTAGLSGFGTGSNLLSVLFTATADGSGTRQPITTRIEVGSHPLGFAGRMLYFGTGKYYEVIDGDPDAAVSPNTFYGIWDKDTGFANAVRSVTNHSANGLDLLRQEVTEDNTGNFRIVTDTAITWRLSGTGDFLGWFVDLPTNGEKMVGNPILRAGRVIFVTTIPSLAPCDSGGTSWLMELSADNGGPLSQPPFDINGDGIFDAADYVDPDSNPGNSNNVIPAGKRSSSGILQPPAILTAPGGQREYKYTSGSEGGNVEVTVENAVPLDFGRKGWWQVK